MSAATTLFNQASTVLAEGSTYSNRAACWIARASLEAAVDDLLASRQRSAPEASMRSKLTILEVAYEDEDHVVVQAEYAWNGLSQACHHHAYELTPSASEVRHLICVVSTLIQRSKSVASQ